MIQVIASSFILVALSEMGDKTQLLAFSLAARFKKPWSIMAGIFVATIFNHGLASYSGEWIAHVFRQDILGYFLGATFIAFGIWTLRPDSLEVKKENPKFGAFITTTVLFFLAEMGDKTQLATLALGAQYRSAVAVTIGTTMGMLITDGLAVFLGEKFAEKVKMEHGRWIAASLFFIFGVLSIFHVVIRYASK